MATDGLFLDNDHIINQRITVKNTLTTVETAGTGLGVTGMIGAIPDATAPIHATLSTPMIENGTTGQYGGILQGADLRTHLTNYVGKTVYEIVYSGQDVRVEKPLTVYKSRRPA